MKRRKKKEKKKRDRHAKRRGRSWMKRWRDGKEGVEKAAKNSRGVEERKENC